MYVFIIIIIIVNELKLAWLLGHFIVTRHINFNQIKL